MIPIADSNPISTLGDQHQRVVNRFFRSHSQHWKQVYEERTLSGVIYRKRRTAVLAMADKLGLPRGTQVLEAGSGGGLTSIALAKRGFVVTAIDSVEAMVRLTRDSVAQAGVEDRVETGLGDIRKLTFPAESYGLIVAIGVVPWLDNPEAAFAEMARVCKPGGYIIITADNRWRLNHIFDPMCFPLLRPVRQMVSQELEKAHLRHSERPRMYWHSMHQIDKLIARSGLCKLEGITVGFGPFTFFRQNLLSDSHAIWVHRKLQALADRGVPGIRSTGSVYAVLSQKPQPSEM